MNDIFENLEEARKFALGMEMTIEDLMEANEELIAEVNKLKEKYETI